MDEVKTLYEYIYEFITTYILPTETALPQYTSVLVVIALVVTLGIFWVWFIRPFWWFFKYGMWGGSKKHSRKNDDD